MIRYHETLDKEKARLLLALESVYLTSTGDAEAFQLIRDGRAVRDAELIPDGEPTQMDLTAISKHLMERLDSLARVRQVIDPDWNDYTEIHRELDRLVDIANQHINRYRVTVLTHYRLASGVKNPAQWFDIDDAPRALLGVGLRASRL